jgi:signal transduction histidine kinase
MEQQQFEGVRRYVGFDSDTSRRLAELHPLVAAELPALVTDFYDAIDREPEASAAITGGAEQRQRLEQSLLRWLESSLTGPHDFAYLAARHRIGMVHVRIGLQQRYMLTAMSRIRVGLSELVRRVYAGDPDRQNATLKAVNRLLDVELAIMLDSYHSYLTERVRNAERLATIGQLAATIGHELRNPLGIIESSMFLLRQRISRLQVDDAQVEKHHDRVQKQVRQCSKTITNLLDLARDRPPKRRREDARELVQQVLDEMDIEPELLVDVQDGIPVDVDPDDFGHVLTNLVANASDAMQGSGRIEISARRQRGGTELFVQDDGPGIPEEIRERVFDALFTTKARGTGLGLALCRRILYAHGGELELEPSEKGARFRMWFPDALDETTDEDLAPSALSGLAPNGSDD